MTWGWWRRCGMGGMSGMSSDRRDGQHDRHGLEPNNLHQNPLEIVHRYHSHQTRYQFDISLAKLDIKQYQLTQK